MAKISVDAALCTGCGLCASTCPEIFEMGDDDIAHVVSNISADCNPKEVAGQCPVEAISVK